MAVGTSVSIQGMGWASILAAVTIGLHNIPEGMSIAIPPAPRWLQAGGAIAISALSGIPTVLGALLGYFIGSKAASALS